MGLIIESLYPMTNLSLSYPCPPNKLLATTFLLSGFFSREYLFIWLHWVLVAAHRIFDLHWSMRDLQFQHTDS